MTEKLSERNVVSKPIPNGNTEAIESRIANYWQVQLGLKDAGSGQDYFELGGDSLYALEMLAFIAEEFNCEIDIERFFDQPTVEAVVAIIREKQEVHRPKAPEAS